MIRIFLLLVCFSYYAIAHGACGTLDSDMARCESQIRLNVHCADSTHSSDGEQATATLHVCGCISMIVQVYNQVPIISVPNVSYDKSRSNCSANEITQRIERPPIAHC